MTQSWHNVLFAHWPVPTDWLAPIVPAEFEIDRFDGSAWVGIVPFYMTNVSARAVPALPWISYFPELNVRTYVQRDGKPGVFFFSLDAASVLAVHAARVLFNLPYHAAAMTVRSSGDGIYYASRRPAPGTAAEFIATYQANGPAFTAKPGSLEYFLTERYCLYGRTHRGHPFRLEIHHPPWVLQAAQSSIGRNTVAKASGIQLPDTPPLQHFAKRQDMVAWWPSI
jgi:uncharacterized protein YqjF (DUF2071 family)